MYCTITIVQRDMRKSITKFVTFIASQLIGNSIRIMLYEPEGRQRPAIGSTKHDFTPVINSVAKHKRDEIAAYV